jgi:hypothetical protein
MALAWPEGQPVAADLAYFYAVVPELSGPMVLIS